MSDRKGRAVTPKASSAKPEKRGRPAPEDVEALLESLDHPLKGAILALRQIILDADPRIAESIKWNAPSFHTSEHFATFQLRARDKAQLILHLGAKVRDIAVTIDDPGALLQWLARDRASATFRDLDEVEASRSAFAHIIRQWIVYV